MKFLKKYIFFAASVKAVTSDMSLSRFIMCVLTISVMPKTQLNRRRCKFALPQLKCSLQGIKTSLVSVVKKAVVRRRWVGVDPCLLFCIATR